MPVQLPVAKLGNFDMNVLLRGAAEFFGETDDSGPWDHPKVMRRFTDLDMAGVVGLEKANAFIEHLYAIVERDRAAAEARRQQEADPVHATERELARHEGLLSTCRDKLQRTQATLEAQRATVRDLEDKRGASCADSAGSWRAATREIEDARIEAERLETLCTRTRFELEGATGLVKDARAQLDKARREHAGDNGASMSEAV